MPNKILIIPVLFFCSCATVRQKEAFIKEQLKLSVDKYRAPKEESIDFSFSISSDLFGNHLRKMKMKTIKQKVQAMVEQMFLTPDSTADYLLNGVKQNGVLDSFYVSQSKKKFITENNLLSPNKHFLEALNK
ncbi:MAG: hypothetical protein JST47_03540 [Bacteroidetes bacterium]|nr:hypothetical protein [Bacteroidota bacterium]